MRALNLLQPYASLIAEGYKTIETRRWRHRPRDGSLLVVASRKPVARRRLKQYRAGYPRLPDPIPYGQAIAVCEIIWTARFSPADEKAACCPWYPAQAWGLAGVRKIHPFEVRGQLGFYDVPDELIRVIEDPQ